MYGRQLTFDGRVAHVGWLRIVGAGAAHNATHPARHRHAFHKRARHYGSSRPSPTPAADDPRAVHFLYATNRVVDKPDKVPPSYGHKRLNYLYPIELGAASVRIPESHKFGGVESPSKFDVITWWTGRVDSKKYVVVQAIKPLEKDEWIKVSRTRKLMRP